MSRRHFHVSVQQCLTLLLIIATAFSIYFMMTTRPKPTVRVNDKTPDRYALHFHLDQYDVTGQIVKTVKAKQAIHINYQDTTLLIHPRLTFLDQQNQPWIITANRAKTLNGGETTIAWGHVKIVQLDTHGQQQLEMHTSWMKYVRATDEATTPKPVKIIRPDSVTTGIGMTANFKTGVFQLLSQAHIVYTPLSS